MNPPSYHHGFLQMTRPVCKFNKSCERGGCLFVHDTKDGRSPVFHHCSFQSRCERPDCYRLHATLDGRSPSRTPSETPTGCTYRFRLVTWNVLSDVLAQKMSSRYPPEVMIPEVRWAKIMARLAEWAEQGLVICLQEVIRERAFEKLAPFAQRHDYKLIYQECGTEFNGFMGNAILVPVRLVVEDTHRLRIAMHTDSKLARSLPNTMLTAVLVDPSTGIRFAVATYHMPCQYKIPEIMQAHGAALQKILRSRPYPVVLAGDMNASPDEVKSWIGLPSVWDTTPMVNTVHNHVQRASPSAGSVAPQGYFIGCLDNIVFHGMRVERVQVDEAATIHLMPNEKEPSDHIPLRADLMIGGDIL